MALISQPPVGQCWNVWYQIKDKLLYFKMMLATQKCLNPIRSKKSPEKLMIFAHFEELARKQNMLIY